jgi:GT2 family glycosyltransferase
VTVVVPTLEADATLEDCIRSLDEQVWRDFEVIIVDNSGEGRARQRIHTRPGLRILENRSNEGFGAAVNAAARVSEGDFVASLNDDAIASPLWLEALVTAMDSREDVGMCASQVRLAGSGRLDSAGMLISGDASSKQRGHGEPPERYSDATETLFPSGSAAMYRRRMLEETGGFDDSFFLYCEDTDLGLRARWSGWECLYVPEAVVEHRYSHSAGRASRLKAYYVERNRLFVLLKNFPLSLLLLAPWYAAARYAFHLLSISRGRGAAAEFLVEGRPLELIWFVVRAHGAAIRNAGRLWRERRATRKRARMTSWQFRRLLRRHWIGPRQVAER